MSLKKYKSQGKAVEVTVNRRKTLGLRLLSGFCPRIWPQHDISLPGCTNVMSNGEIPWIRISM